MLRDNAIAKIDGVSLQFAARIYPRITLTISVLRVYKVTTLLDCSLKFAILVPRGSANTKPDALTFYTSLVSFDDTRTEIDGRTEQPQQQG